MVREPRRSHPRGPKKVVKEKMAQQYIHIRNRFASFSPLIRLVVFILPFVVIAGAVLLFVSRADVVLKPVAKGMMSYNGALPDDLESVDNLVIQVNWSDLESADQNFSGSGWAYIDNLLNSTGPYAGKRVPVAARLRVRVGVNAPDFVKKIYPSGKSFINKAEVKDTKGTTDPSDDVIISPAINCETSGGIAYYNTYDKKAGCIPYFWTDPVLDQYEQLMAEVATRYETNPKVRDVVDAACMTYYAEPFYRKGDGNFDRLLSAGLTHTLDYDCHTRAIQIHNAAFITTRTSLAINSWDNVDNGAREWDVDPLDSCPLSKKTVKCLIDWAKAEMGQKLILQNNGLGEDDGCPAGATTVGPEFCYIKNSGQPAGFQSETFDRIANNPSTSAAEICSSFRTGFMNMADNALTNNGAFIEIPPIPVSVKRGTATIPINCPYADVETQLNAKDSLLEAKAAGGETTTAADSAGIWMVWGDLNTAQKHFVMGGQVVGEWAEIEPTNNSFDWSKLGSEGRGFIRNYTDPSATPYVNKPFTVQVNSTKKPCNTDDPSCVGSSKKVCNVGESGCLNKLGEICTIATDTPAAVKNACRSTTRWDTTVPGWPGYGSTVAWCGILHPKNNYNFEQDVPQFWDNNASDKVNEAYITMMRDMIGGLDGYLEASAFTNKILGVRTSPNLIGTEHDAFGPNWTITNIPSRPECDRSTWPGASGQNAYEKVMDIYKEKFADASSTVKPIYRAEHWNLSPADKSLFFYTNGNPDAESHYKSTDAFYANARNGARRAFYEPFLASTAYTNPTSWNYWLVLQQLSRGVNYIAIYGDDLKLAATDPCPSNILATTKTGTSTPAMVLETKGTEYEMAYCFANKYAKYANAQNTASQAQASPGAWLAFTRISHSQNADGSSDNLGDGYIGMYLKGNGITNTNSSDVNISLPTTVNSSALGAAGGSLGNPAQRYGRYARKITSTQSLAMNLEAHFKASLSGTSPSVNVTYLDSGTGTVTVRWGSASQPCPTKTNSGNWVTCTKTFAASALPTGGNDIVLTSNDGTTFHMVEVMRAEGGCTGDCAAPTAEIINPTNGDTVSGVTTIIADVNDTDGTINRVEFFAGTTLISGCSDTTPPYQCSWSTTGTPNGSYNLTAKAYDNATPAHVGTSAVVGVSVNNSSGDTTAPAPPTGLTTTIPVTGSGSVTLSWTANTESDLAGYIIKYKPSSGSTWSETALIASPATTRTINDLTIGTAYDFQIRARDNASPPNNSAWAPTTPVTATPLDRTKPSVPASLSLNSAATHNQVNLVWNASTDNVAVKEYQVYRTGGSSPTGPLATVTHPTTTYTDNTVSSSTNYSYSVKAVDTATTPNISDPSNTLAVTTPAPPDTTNPNAPTTFTATAPAHNQVNLSWSGATDNIGVHHYVVQRNGVTLSSSVTGTTYSDTTVAASTDYNYVVCSVDAATNVSTPCKAATPSPITTPSVPDTTAPTIPTNLVATTPAYNQVNLSWTASTDGPGGSGMKGYIITRTNTSTSESVSYTHLSSATGTISKGFSSVPAGSFTYKVKAYDSASTPNYSADSTPKTVTVTAGGSGLRGEYYRGKIFGGAATLRADPFIDFDWGTGTPGAIDTANNFSIRWTGFVQPQYTQAYTFYITTDERARLWVNNTLLVDQWYSTSTGEVISNTINLNAGTKYSIKIEYYEELGNALIKLKWSSSSTPKARVPAARLFPN